MSNVRRKFIGTFALDSLTNERDHHFSLFSPLSKIMGWTHLTFDVRWMASLLWTTDCIAMFPGSPQTVAPKWAKIGGNSAVNYMHICICYIGVAANSSQRRQHVDSIYM